MNITTKKYKDLEKELTHRKNVLRPKILKEVKYAAEIGDFYRENFPFDAAMEKKKLNEDRIAEIAYMLKYATIIGNADSSGVITVGAFVVLKRSDGRELELQIVESHEANSRKRKISVKSPMGTKVLNRKIGFTFELNEMQYQIVSIK